MAGSGEMAMHVLNGEEGETRTFAVFFAVSMCCHLIFLLLIMLSPDFHLFKSPPRPAVMQVSMVYMPEGKPAPGPPAAPAPKPAPATPAPAQQAPKPVETKAKTVIPPTPKPAAKPVPAEPKFKEKISLKKETVKKNVQIVKPEKTPPVKPASVEEVKPEPKTQKEPEPSGPSQEELKTQALEKIRQRVSQTGGRAANTSAVSADGRTGTGAGGLMGGTDAGGPIVGDAFQLYQQEVGYRVQLNWAYSNLEGSLSQKLEVLVAIKIGADGRILDIWFDKKSGNSRLDDSAKKAIQKSDPLPKPPLGRREFVMGLRFSPEGVK